MKLSEAIVEGSKLHPQCYGDYVEYDRNGNIAASCALGAAAVALGLDSPFGVQVRWDLSNEYPQLFEQKDIKCPECGFRKEALWYLIGHLNSIHKLTREEIAKIVEGYEEA